MNSNVLLKYAGPGRFYHNFTHIGYMLENLQELYANDLTHKEELTLRYAIIYHDVIYDAGAQDNEFRSAIELANDLNGELQHSSDIREAQRLIMLTQHHRPSPSDKLGAIICDLDLAGLGSPRYEQNRIWVRQEYEWAARRAGDSIFLSEKFDADWIEGRKKFLSEYLNRNSLFNTDLGKKLWEKRALNNMEHELSTLS